MLYSPGSKAKYEADFATGLQPQKAGRGYIENGKPAFGGAVFQTIMEAQAYGAERTRKDGIERYVLKVDADWAKDTYQRPGEKFRRLTRNADVFRL
jgi:hypothetical protein